MDGTVIGLVGVTGLAGVGKTTAGKYLSNSTGGRYFYLGQTVLDQVRARRLPQTPESERQVRIDLRRKNGPEALVLPYLDEVAECLGNGIPVFIDAIFNQEELNLLRSRVPSGHARLLAIDASFDIRLTRLASRPERRFNADELRKRDKYELEVLRTSAVIAAAGNTISNEHTFKEFYARLEEFVSRCA
ncbi:MAG TPA: AAA family ATPase [Candidatus Solibacter sp.]|nr:AAA family ATPase [Candidatus Solibacter sp.]